MFREEGDGDSREGTAQGGGGSRPDSSARAAELLRHAVGYALGTAQCVTPALLHLPTPCTEWDLGGLMSHADDSLAALHEGMAQGTVALHPDPAQGAARGDGYAAETGPPARGDPAAAFRLRAARLLGAWTAAGPRRRLIVVADAPLTATALALTGAVEMAVHGWDIARATGSADRPIPAPLAVRLLPVARHLIPHEGARHPLFAAELPVAPGAPPGDRLLAFLGRDPAYGT
ncbi:TIGR03086 family protein [Streptomyces oryzae]|uniref:TIGR03086 family protein n=1 Tax=Streptomyces oryzae TaxID=1434886 RepID=A0ABS3X504_9ACTN|nr:TIGR03086 family metal-binding protein [Streptomyces oryzae]MBO8190460.1 TIGR03086 family protein [Streptomyces oryzae]